MNALRDMSTIAEVWTAAVHAWGDRPFVVVPDGPELSYAQADVDVRRWIDVYQRAGYGPGHRVALLLENRIEHFVHKLALNAIGVSCVPVNPDYRPGEIAYLLDHAEPQAVLVLSSRVDQVRHGLAQAVHRAPLVVVDDGDHPPAPGRPRQPGPVTPLTEASLLYTSGTTGRPKGCQLSHGYEVAAGAWYAQMPGLAGLRAGQDRIYNPLPLYHVNAGVVSLFGAIVSGCCQIQPDRFHAQRWWDEVVRTRATVVHYLGIVVQALMLQPAGEPAPPHQVRVGFGAGVEPPLQAAFEARFGFPLVELWGMTEMVRILSDCVEPRQVGTRAFGRAVPGIDVRVVDDGDLDVPDGSPGEMLVRHSAATPRRGAFSGYLKNEAETEAAWRGGWFHTGDAVWRGADGMLHFVERKKNIIRRSGENIAAAEIEATLLTHPNVLQAAVMAVKDDVREEEVLACVVLKDRSLAAPAEALFQHCYDRLAYYKAPGWIHIVASLPTTGTQKIQKHSIYPAGTDPRMLPDVVDLRSRKRRA